MTGYAAIADSDVDPESPGTTTLFTRLRNNPIAMTEGDATAPKHQTDAIEDDAILMSSKVNKTIADDGSFSLISGASHIPTPAGFYNFAGGPGLVFQIFQGVSWKGSTAADNTAGGTFWCDGANMRIYNRDSATQTFYWQRMS